MVVLLLTLNNQMQVGLYFLLALRKAMTKRRILYVIRVPKLPERPEHSKISGNQHFFSKVLKKFGNFIFVGCCNGKHGSIASSSNQYCNNNLNWEFLAS